MDPDKHSLDSVLRHRTVIPRWKPPQQAVETYCFDESRLLRRKTQAGHWIKHLTALFERLPTPNTANELYETALLYGNAESLPRNVREFSQKLRNAIAPPHNTPWHYGATQERPTLILGTTSNAHEDTARIEIHRLRKLLRTSPDRPFCWSELARHFLAVGQKEKAIQCMQVALQLANHSRYLYRAAARLFVHVEDPHRALALLRSEPEIASDPWLLAADIAISSITGKKSRFIDAGKRLISSNDCNDKQLSELAAALATVELNHGANKRAKALFNRSLIAPTENALAQAQWAVEQDAKIVIPAAAWYTPASYEANTLASRQAHNWTDALQSCAKWLSDEPFSARPALMGSYIGFRPEHQEMAEQFATAGLRSDSANFSLLNNRAVARAYQGKVIDAYKDVKLALQYGPARDSAHLIATLGLIAFRSGMPELGREYYGLSIAWCSQSKQRTGAALAILNLLREEIRIDRSAVPQLVEIVQRIAKLPIVMREPELVGITKLILEEARPSVKLDRGSNDLALIKPASANEFTYHASLFHVPEKAKQIVTRLGDLSELI